MDFETIKAQRERIEHLEFCIREITAFETDDPAIPEGLNLSVTKRRILGALIKAKGRYMSTGQIMAAAYWDRLGEWPDQHVIQVYVCKIRRALRDADVPLVIESAWGFGYRARSTETELKRHEQEPR